MKARAACILACIVVFTACRKESEVVVTETRPATTKDGAPKLNATSNERFRDAKPSPIRGETPEGWLELPPSQFRMLNYRFGETGLGEMWVTLASGGVLDNVNRWLNQFAAQPLDAAGLNSLKTVPVLGTTGVWVEAEGEYASGMGAPPRPGYGLAGVVAEYRGQILTVKMVGPKAEVEAARPVLEAYVRSLAPAE